jgi:glycosyltransferase involved in cell wall biosynthesis
MMNNQPKVSIGVPVYNGERFMEDCLESILKQTFISWECVIVNNCSTDRTEEIIKQFVERDNRFKLFTYSDFVSLERNWNRLYNHISTESDYFKVVQADDIIPPESLEEMIKLLDQYPNAGTCTSYRIDGVKIDGGGLNYFDGPIFKGKDLLYRHLKGGLDITGTVTTPLFRKVSLEKLPTFPDIFDDKDYHLDTLLMYEMMNIADVAFVFKVLSLTRWHEGAGTVTTALKYKTFLCSKENRLFKFKENFPELEHDYREHRLKYAYLLIKERLKGNKECIAWHRKRLLRKFTFSEYMRALLLNNGIVWRFSAPIRKKRAPKVTIQLNN